MDLVAKSEFLDATLRNCNSLLVAYSGGTDSAFLAFAAYEALGSQMLAVIADSASLPRQELTAALRFSAVHGIPTRVLQTSELANPDYRRNDSNRCFHCKDELFTQLEALRQRLSLSHIAFGMNIDDLGDHRPGQRAAINHQVLAPLVTAELSKAEIRQLALGKGLELYDKPASACLSSRIAYGLPVTVERLSQVERAEEFLHSIGFPRVRVRHHDSLARIEFDREDLPRAMQVKVLDQISNSLKAVGFTFVTVDAQGYRSGSMNAMLPASAITPASHV